MARKQAQALAALAALAVLAAGSRSARGASGVTGARGGGGRALPWLYAEGNVLKLSRRYERPDIREATARFGAHYLPGVCISALIAAGVTSTSATEHGGPPDYATGLYGVEWQWWQTVAGDAETRAVLGRAGPSTLAGFDRDITAQCFAGMRTYRRHLDAVAAQLVAAHRPQLAAGDAVWRYRLATAGYSAGPATVAGTIAAALTDRPATGATWRELAAAVDHLCPDCAHHVGPVACCGRWHAADVVIRNDGRFEAGLLLARDQVPEDVPWYVGAITRADLDVARRLTARVNAT